MNDTYNDAVYTYHGGIHVSIWIPILCVTSLLITLFDIQTFNTKRFLCRFLNQVCQPMKLEFQMYSVEVKGGGVTNQVILTVQNGYCY